VLGAGEDLDRLIGAGSETHFYYHEDDEFQIVLHEGFGDGDHSQFGISTMVGLAECLEDETTDEDTPPAEPRDGEPPRDAAPCPPPVAARPVWRSWRSWAAGGLMAVRRRS
jgi:hypothetical protein